VKLIIKGAPIEQLLFQLLGIQPEGDKQEKETCGLLLGKDEPLPLAHDGKDSLLYLRLPNTSSPLEETERLSRLLARAIGQGEVHL